MGRRRKEKKTKVELEDYEHFLHNPYDQAISYDQLNQMIFMHGFKKMHKRRKIELYEALSTIDLLKPQRSTLKDKFSPYDSSLSLDQVKKDLEALEWKECPVQSIQVINPSHHDDEDKDEVRIKSKGCDSSFKISRKKMKSKRQSRSMKSIVSDGGGAQQNNLVAGGDVGVGGRALFVDTYSWEF